MKMLWVRFILVTAVLLKVSIAQAASDIVLIDRSDAAYTVYAGLPANRSEEVSAKIGNQPVQLVSFKEFADLPEKFIGEHIVDDEYAGSRAREGLVELVRKYPGTPFGITWNGGIAYTRMDYQFTKRQFESYRKDPEEYRRTRNADRTADPVHPMSHLRPLLGW